MAFIQFTGLSLAFADRDILKNCNFFLKSGSKAALCGANGSGKSTLLKIIAGEIKADSGNRAVEKGVRVAYLPQSGIVHRDKTLFEEVEAAYKDIKAMLNKSEELGVLLQNSKEDDANTRALIVEQHNLINAVIASGYHNRKKNISVVLSGLGFKNDDIDRETSEFSGGWQMRIALAKVLLENPDILLLDEPTNYLDIEARAWLESWLQNFLGAYILVSHDRYFLDVTVNEIYELFQGKLTRYPGNYSSYQAKRAVELETLIARHKAQQEEIKKSEDIIRRFRYKASKAAMAQERIKKLEKMEIIEIPESLKKIDIALPPPPHSGKIALTIESVSKQYGARQVLSHIDLTIEAGERLLVAGENGAGKTTLLRILAGADKDFSGHLKYGAGICAGYFTQDTTETISGTETVLEFLESSAPTELIPKLRDMLGAFLFRGDDVHKILNVLSGGEKSRLALLQLLLHPLNLLILDEPTNHLDLYSKDVLLDALAKWTGTIVFVSHDRAFMEALSTKTLELRPGAQSTLYYGNYTYYLDRKAAAINHGAGISPAPAAALPDGDEADVPYSNKNNTQTMPAQSAGQFREEQKKQEAARRRREREEQKIIGEIEVLEKEKSELETELSKPAIYSSFEKAKTARQNLNNILAKLEAATKKWEAMSDDTL